MKSAMDERTESPTIEPGTIPEVHFDRGLPGFAAAKRFVLVPWGSADSPFSLMRSLDDPDLEFVVAMPGTFFPDYAPELDDDSAAELGLTQADDALVLVIVNVPDRAEDSTVNLLGPLVINRHTRRGMQAVLNEAWSTRHPLFAGTAAPA